MKTGEGSRWRQWVRRLTAHSPTGSDNVADHAPIVISDVRSREMRARALECNLFVVVPDRDIMIVGADDQDPGPAAPPFADFMRVVGDEGPAEYEYLWMIDLLPDDPRVFLEIAFSRPVKENFLFSFPVPQFTPFLERIEREDVLYLSTRKSIESALKHGQPQEAIGVTFDGTQISQLLQRYGEWDAAGRRR